MLHNLSVDQKQQLRRKRTAFGAMIIFTLALSQFSLAASPAKQKTFATPEEAVKSAVAATKNNDDKEFLAIFGAQAKDLLSSGDPVADNERRAHFLAAYNQKNRLVAARRGHGFS